MYCSTEFANNNTVAVRYQTFECHVSLCTWMCESKSERALINVFSFSHFALCRSVCVCVCVLTHYSVDFICVCLSWVHSTFVAPLLQRVQLLFIYYYNYYCMYSCWVFVRHCNYMYAVSLFLPIGSQLYTYDYLVADLKR